MYKKLLLTVALILISLELILNLVKENLSKDLLHYSKMDTIISNITSITSQDKEKYLFLGNSLTRHGIIPSIIETQSSQIEMIYPDDTTIIEWYWISKSKITPQHAINNLVLSYAGHQLEDKNLEDQQLIRIASVIQTNELLEVYKFETLTINQFITLLLSKASLIYALRERINRRVLDLLPHYRNTASTINKHLKNTTHSSSATVRPSYKHLQQLIQLCHKHKIDLTIVALPLPAQYPLDKYIQELDHQNIITLIDARNIKTINKEDYLDGYHLNPSGAKKLSSYLTKKLK